MAHPTAPAAPAEAPMLWSLLMVARREAQPAHGGASPIDNPLAGQVSDGLVTATDLAVEPEPPDPWPPASFSGKPSVVSGAFSAVFRLVGAIGNAIGVDITIPLARLLSSAHPPRLITRGLTVQRSEFDGMAVWALSTPEPSGKQVVAVHGGADVVQPLVLNWLNYAAIVRNTGATLIVPIYPLVQQGGTAGAVVPSVADLISAQIDQHGASNVSVYGDSAGGGIALASVQELVRRGMTVPARMVLSSPALDATLGNPLIPYVNDPVFPAVTVPHLDRIAERWAGGRDLTDPLVSPLYGSLAGLPPTAVYAGSRDVVAPDVLALRDIALATPGADFTFVLRKGEPHDWAIVTILPETRAVLPDIYRQLGIVSDSSGSTTAISVGLARMS